MNGGREREWLRETIQPDRRARDTSPIFDLASRMPSPDAPPSKLDAETFQRLHPRIYFERFLAEGIRPDGREIGSWRNVSVNVGNEFSFHSFMKHRRLII